jgi:acyl dehydratase
MTARFVHPIYDGEEITVTAQPDASADAESLGLEVKGSSGVVCAVGSATLLPYAASVDISIYQSAALLSTTPEASAESFAAAPTLGSVEGEFSAADAKAFLDLIDDSLPLYVEERIAHPGWLLTWANLALTSNFRLGPWIHTSSDVQWLGVVTDGDRLATRGKVVKTFERKGHEFVELEVVLVSNGTRPVMHVRHVAIYKPRELSGS